MLPPRGAGLRARTPAPQRQERRLERDRLKRCRGQMRAIPTTEPDTRATWALSAFADGCSP
eukprot:10451166-Alexandrium_andersonii.AAC.1